MQASTDRRFGTIFKRGMQGIPARDQRTTDLVGIFKGKCRDPRTAESDQILKRGSKEPRTAESVQIFKGESRDLRTADLVHFLKEVCREPPNQSEFTKRDSRIH